MTLFDLSRKESQPRNIIDSGYDMENVWNVISVTRETITDYVYIEKCHFSHRVSFTDTHT